MEADEKHRNRLLSNPTFVNIGAGACITNIITAALHYSAPTESAHHPLARLFFVLGGLVTLPFLAKKIGGVLTSLDDFFSDSASSIESMKIKYAALEERLEHILEDLRGALDIELEASEIITHKDGINFRFEFSNFPYDKKVEERRDQLKTDIDGIVKSGIAFRHSANMGLFSEDSLHPISIYHSISNGNVALSIDLKALSCLGYALAKGDTKVAIDKICDSTCDTGNVNLTEAYVSISELAIDEICRHLDRVSGQIRRAIGIFKHQNSIEREEMQAAGESTNLLQENKKEVIVQV